MRPGRGFRQWLRADDLKLSQEAPGETHGKSYQTCQSLEGQKRGAGEAGSPGEGHGKCANGSKHEEASLRKMVLTSHHQPVLGLRWGT